MLGAWKKTIRKLHDCGKLILRLISKIGATRCQILRPKCTKVDFHWGSAPDPTWETYTTLPNFLVVFKGASSRGRKEGMGKGREAEGGRLGRQEGARKKCEA